jgi:hypothetical protein
MKDRGQYACLDCRHCYIDFGEPGYSEYTPASPGDWMCRRGVWDVDSHVSSINNSRRDFAALLDKGRTCPQFEAEEIKT